MSQYVNICSVELNGQDISEYLSTFSDNNTVVAKAVNLMNKTGIAQMTPRYGFSLEVKKPYLGSIDLDSIINGTATVQYDNGERFLYRGVSILETGDGAVDGETELTYTKLFMATNKEKEN